MLSLRVADMLCISVSQTLTSFAFTCICLSTSSCNLKLQREIESFMLFPFCCTASWNVFVHKYHMHMCTNKTRQELLWPALLHYQLVCAHLMIYEGHWNAIVHTVMICYCSLTVLETLVKKLQWEVVNDDVKFRSSKERVGWIGFIACILWFLFIYFSYIL